MSEYHYPYKLNKVQIWFAAQPKVASEGVKEFCFTMSPEDAIKYLEAHLTQRAADLPKADACTECFGVIGFHTDYCSHNPANR
jgi:hypothetical protein